MDQQKRLEELERLAHAYFGAKHAALEALVASARKHGEALPEPLVFVEA